ncbi:MAG: peptide chain release factor N(5)-glutamine methyltransferase [Nitriliruptoraceae bacterium]
MIQTQPRTAGDVAEEVAAQLAVAAVPAADVDARWLIASFLKVDPWQSPDTPVTLTCALAEAVARRARREPLQLIVGSTAFLDLTIACRPGVFIPRPETEMLAEMAIAAALERDAAIVAEPCTGSGAIACAVAAHVPGVTIVATDVDEAAVTLARDNAMMTLDAASHAATIKVLRGDLFTPVAPAFAGRVDVVVANPPYLPASDVGSWMPEVSDHDPPGALVAGPDGNETVVRIMHDARKWLRPEGVVMMEIDTRRANEVVALARSVGWSDIEVVDDLTGRPRFILLRGPQSRVA